ncbi:MAG: hypothetical protein ACJAVM_002887 [Sulfitobacter sp.]|jgi:hypothetical protein
MTRPVSAFPKRSGAQDIFHPAASVNIQRRADNNGALDLEMESSG